MSIKEADRVIPATSGDQAPTRERRSVVRPSRMKRYEPIVIGTLSVALVLRMIEAFKVFDIIYLMTRGGPADSTKSVSFFVYQESFAYLRAGSGASYAVTVTLTSGVMIAAYIFLLRRQSPTS